MTGDAAGLAALVVLVVMAVCLVVGAWRRVDRLARPYEVPKTRIGRLVDFVTAPFRWLR